MGAHRVRRGASPLGKEQQEPRRGGVKSARGWLGRTKQSFFWGAAREQDTYRGRVLLGPAR